MRPATPTKPAPPAAGGGSGARIPFPGPGNSGPCSSTASPPTSTALPAKSAGNAPTPPSRPRWPASSASTTRLFLRLVTRSQPVTLWDLEIRRARYGPHGNGDPHAAFRLRFGKHRFKRKFGAPDPDSQTISLTGKHVPETPHRAAQWSASHHGLTDKDFKSRDPVHWSRPFTQSWLTCESVRSDPILRPHSFRMPKKPASPIRWRSGFGPPLPGWLRFLPR